MLASALAVLAARGEQKAASVTLLTTMLDFTDTGEIGLLVTEDGVAQREATIGKGGLLKGSELAQVFASLRANDLIWPYVVKGYLKGQAPPAFDLLYWNSDDTNLPGPDVLLVRPQHLPGEQAARARRDGAAAACRSTWAASTFRPSSTPPRRTTSCRGRRPTRARSSLAGDRTFVLGASGHIAGVINPPAKMKRNFWVHTDGALDADAETWFAGAEKVPGSWWPTWHEWLATYARRAGRRADIAGQRGVLGDRAGARQLRQGEGRVTE